MRLGGVSVLFRDFCCTQHLYQRILRQMSEVAMQSPDDNACSVGQRQPQLLALYLAGWIAWQWNEAFFAMYERDRMLDDPNPDHIRRRF